MEGKYDVVAWVVNYKIRDTEPIYLARCVGLQIANDVRARNKTKYKNLIDIFKHPTHFKRK